MGYMLRLWANEISNDSPGEPVCMKPVDGMGSNRWTYLGVMLLKKVAGFLSGAPVSLTESQFCGSSRGYD